MFLGVLGCSCVCTLQRYFGIYLLRGISTLRAPARPRTPVRTCARSCTRLYALVRSCARVPAPTCAPALLIRAVASPRRACAPTCAPWVSCALLGSLQVLASFVYLDALLTSWVLPLSRFGACCALLGPFLGTLLGYASAWLSAWLS